jgi:hypothetical protein
MGANNSNTKYHQNLCNTPPKKNNHQFLFDPRSPSGKRIFQIIQFSLFFCLLRWYFSNTHSNR